jgi:hypothetical protein
MRDPKDHTKDLPKIWGGSKFNEKGGSNLLGLLTHKKMLPEGSLAGRG